IQLAILWYVAFLFSLVLHEASHGWAALRLGDPTAYHAGQVTLNPIPHIKREFIGTVVVPILSFVLGGWMMGWASAPYNPRWALYYPKRSALMALAGPAANLFIFLVATFFIKLGYAYGIFEAPQHINFSQVTISVQAGIWASVAKMLSIFFSLNLILCIFNLLPLPPLDGSQLLLLFAKGSWQTKIHQFLFHPQFSFLGLFAAWYLFNPIFDPIHHICINLLYPGISYY
ncbi:MAG: site-2 protease family protein, partial [Deltaproteobacteria bacterium]|nr:site-2 protease family protein [Deltaproteobacteria bacterium]